MLQNTLTLSLLNLGRLADFASIAMLPGAGLPQQVISFSDQLRGPALAQIENLKNQDRVCFAKALAVYEDTVGGLGSVTALQRVLPLIVDNNHEVLDWILSNTRSFWYYTYGAKSYAELKAIRIAHSAVVSENEKKERERAHQAKIRRAERATKKLFNAIRRGDFNAVHSLLCSGASVDGFSPSGQTFIEYAVEIGKAEIADLLRNHKLNCDA